MKKLSKAQVIAELAGAMATGQDVVEVASRLGLECAPSAYYSSPSLGTIMHAEVERVATLIAADLKSYNLIKNNSNGCGKNPREEALKEAIFDVAQNVGADDNDLARSLIGVRAMQRYCHAQQVNNGWWNGIDGKPINRNHGEIFALIISEVTEALEGDRKGLADEHVQGRKNVEVELADAVCRIFDAAQAWGLDIAGALVEKMAYNARRADHKPENRQKDGGKKY